jgi:hypothetical protein
MTKFYISCAKSFKTEKKMANLFFGLGNSPTANNLSPVCALPPERTGAPGGTMVYKDQSGNYCRVDLPVLPGFGCDPSVIRITGTNSEGTIMKWTAYSEVDSNGGLFNSRMANVSGPYPPPGSEVGRWMEESVLAAEQAVQLIKFNRGEAPDGSLYPCMPDKAKVRLGLPQNLPRHAPVARPFMDMPNP